MPADSNTAPDIAANTRPLPGAWLTVGLLWVVGCLNYLDRVMLNTMRISIKEAIPMGDDDFGALTMWFLVVYGILSPVGGWCADRFNRSRVILTSLAVWSLVTWATAYVQTYEQLLATRILMGISEACYIPASLALIADYHRGSTRSLATGIHMTGIYVGMALGGMGGSMAEDYGWNSSFMVFGGFGVAYAVLVGILLRDAPAAPRAASEAETVRETPGAILGALFRNGRLGVLALHWSLLGFAGWAFMTWMPTFIQEKFNLTQGKAGFTATAYMQTAQLFGVLAGGAWADRWSRSSARGRVLVPCIALTLASPFVFMTANASVLWIAIAGMIVYGLARGCSDSNMMPILCQVVEPRHRATGYGLLNFLGCLVGGIAAYLGGVFKENKVDLSLLIISSAVGVLLAGLLLLAVKPARRE